MLEGAHVRHHGRIKRVVNLSSIKMLVGNISRVLVLVMCHVYVLAQFDDPKVSIQALIPKGIRISLQELEPNMRLFDIILDINKKVFYNAKLTNNTDGRWSYQGNDLMLETGDVIDYSFNYIKDDGYMRSDYLHTFIVQDLVDSTSSAEAQPPVCPNTPTIVRGMKACGGQIIFEDNFDSLREDVWRLEQYIPDEPDFAFVSYQRPPNAPTISVEEGYLRIEPRLQQTLPSFNSQSIISGTLDLTDGCTSSFTKCKMQASEFNILPPIASGRMSTKSFAFTYGIVEIRAKLPQGDWLYPDILLKSFYEKYGSLNYASGVMRIAGARGNMELKEGFREYGNKALYGGLLLNVECRKHLLHLKRNRVAWGDDFHVYSLRWAPERITFYVDGKEWFTAEPGTFGFQEVFPKYCQLPRSMSSTGAKIAPFDELFGITLGVAAGGNLEFNDNVTSNGEEKPWKNSERKGSLYFWQDILSWWPRWTQPALIVDYVKVYAL